jgi:hypothetical protein
MTQQRSEPVVWFEKRKEKEAQRMSVITDLIEANEAMTAAYEDRSGSLAVFKRQNDAAERVYQLTDAAAEEFAALNGWRIARTPFAPDCIGRKRYTSNRYLPVQSWLDHPVFYRTKDSTAAAIVSQPYGDLSQFRDELDAIIQRAGLKWQVPPNERASFWFPGKTLFIVLTLPEHSIIWFPEQQEIPPGLSPDACRWDV